MLFSQPEAHYHWVLTTPYALLMQNATLSSSLESVREELASVVEERARNDTHSRETEKRQQQVINDLTEQVHYNTHEYYDDWSHVVIGR